VGQQNAAGGVYVGAFNKKIPIKLISYDDQSNTATAATLYNQLITQDKVDILMADSGSVLTSVGVPIAKEHKQFLFDVSGSGAAFFTKDNPYIALICLAETAVAPKYLADFLNNDGPKYGLKRVAIIDSTNDYTGALAKALSGMLKSAGKVEIVYEQGVPTSTSNYTVLINNIAATHPDAVVELGYVGNDIAFLRNLQDSGVKFPFVFTIYSGAEIDEVGHAVGIAGMTNVFSYVTGANYNFKPTFGPTTDALHAMWDKAYPAGSGVNWGMNAVYGYTAAMVVERTLATTKSLSQLDLHDAIFGLSGKLTTMTGPFELNAEGGEVGELNPIGQLRPDGKGGLHIEAVYPPRFANAEPIFSK
jgi:branched-chain amino acid transport system substrate-binding protein